MWNADESQAGIKSARRNINNLRYTDDTTQMAERETRVSWWWWKWRVKKLAWNSTFRKLTSWHLVPSLYGKEKWKKLKQWQTLFSWAPKSLQMVIAAMKLKDTCSLKRKAMTNLDSVLKSRDITFPTKVYKATVFPVVMYGCENWTIKKAEHSRIDAFELWYWRRLLRVSWTARRSNQSILKEISPAYSLEGLMLKLNTLATWCEEPTLWKRPWCWERVKAGREGDNRGWDGWMASPIQWTWVWASSGRWWMTGKPGVLHSMGWQSWIQLIN